MKKFILILLVCLCYKTQAQNNVSVKEYKKVFTTYPFSDPDPIPKPGTKTYPYFRFDGFTDKPVQKEWKVVELENDYIKVMILPEIGGKIWSATEKSTGKDFIYNNHVVKFRDVAMRGPWTSGGIEANYGIIGHTPNCATAVDYTILKKEDGSISCVIGTLDLLTRTYWSLDINLPKDKAYVTTSSFWHNKTDAVQPYYTWMNTGLKAAGNLEFIYPGNHYLGHEGEYSDWPVNKKNNKPINWYDSNNFGGYKSYHVFGKYTDFFGAYWHKDEFGMGRYSNHDDKPGKKIWIWGLSQQGMIWEKLLSDNDGQYVEVQSGRLFNQSSEGSALTPFKHRSFSPYQTDTWTEYWFPVKQTKGFVKANNYGAVNLKSENGWLKIYFSSLQTLHDKIEVWNDGKSIYSKEIDAVPLKLFADSVRVSADVSKLKLTIGENKLVWIGEKTEGDLHRPMETPKDFNNESVYGLYLQGKNYISFKDYVVAEEKLKACLQRDPYYAPALCDLASLQIRRFQYDEALKTVSTALSIDSYDPAANYYYGVANLALGNLTDAKDGFDIAAANMEYRAAAYNELAKIYFRSKEYNKAIEYAQKSLLSNQLNVDAMQLLAVIYRLQNNKAKADELLQSIKSIEPLNHFADFESYYSSRSNDAKEKFVQQFKNELPQQSFLELGTWYQQLNLIDEAIAVFDLAPQNAEIIYWKAYLQNKPVDINTINTGTDFPFRSETAAILQKLIASNNHWLLKYHLGLIEWNRNNIEAAKKLFTDCGEEPNDANFYAAKASLFKADAATALDDLQKAISLDGNNWRYQKLLTEYYIAQKQYDKAMDIAATYYQQHKEDYRMGTLYATTLILNKKYAAADALLTNINILPFEGATEGKRLYREVKLMQAVNAMKSGQYKKALPFIASAKSWPANLGVGRPYDEEIDERLENWLSYECYNKLGNKTAANAALNRIIAFTPRVDNTVMNFLPGNHLVSAWALEKTQSKQAAETWLQQQAKLFPSNKIIKWALNEFMQQQNDVLKEEEKSGEVRVLESLLKK